MVANVILLILILGILMLGIRHIRKAMRSGCCGAGGDAPRAVRVRDRDLSHYPYEKIIAVSGMSCANCAVRVQNALNALDGVFSKVDLQKQQAVVHMKSELPDQALQKAVSDAGYRASSINHAHS